MRKKIISLYFGILIAVAIFTVISTNIAVGRLKSTYLENISRNEKLSISQRKSAFSAIINRLLADVAILAEYTSQGIRHNTDVYRMKADLGRYYLLFSRNRKIYDQVRYIDIQGKEVVRVDYINGEAVLIPQEQLQNKSARYYFRNALAGKGKVYLSRLDLNVERGQVQVPHKPMLRIARAFAVQDEIQKNRIAGVIVLNYLADNVIQQVHDAKHGLSGNLYLINSTGDWLVGPPGIEPFGYMFNRFTVLGQNFAEAWITIQADSFGNFINSEGMFTFDTVDPGEKDFNPVVSVGRAEEGWKLVSHIPQNKLNPPWIPAIYQAMAAVFSVVAVLSWFLAAALIRKKYSQEKLLQNQALLKAVTDAVKDAILIVDARGTAHFCNDGFKAMFGYSLKDIPGKDLVSTVIDPKDQIHIREACVNVLTRNPETGETVLVEATGISRKNTSIPVEIAIGPIELNGTVHTAWVVRDISFRKVVESKLTAYRENLEKMVEKRTRELSLSHKKLISEMRIKRKFELEHSRLMAAVENSPIAVLITDKSGRIEFASANYYTQTGYGTEDIVGSDYRTLIGLNATTDFYQELWKSILNNQIWRGELNCLKKNSSTYWAIASIASGRDDEYNLSHLIFVLQDISSRKQMERELLKSRMLARQTETATHRFYANVSQSICRFLDNFRKRCATVKENTSWEVQDKIASLDGEYDIYHRVFQRISDYSNLVTGDIDSVHSTFDVKQAIRETCRPIFETAGKNGIRTTLTFDGKIPKRLKGDRAMLTRVIEEIITNAVSSISADANSAESGDTASGEEKTIRVSVLMKQQKTHQCRLFFSITDTGVGIEKEKWEMIYLPYVAIGENKSDEPVTTGLGLSIASELVKRMGGEIEIKSIIDQGTTFYFTLVFDFPETGKRVEAKLSESIPQPSGREDGSGLRVLVVDDSDLNRAMARAMLESMSFGVEEAGNGIEAVEMLMADEMFARFNVILMDLEMPGMTGLEATRIIRKWEAKRKADGETPLLRLPIIGLTAGAIGTVKQKCLEAGMDDALTKPAEKEQLLAKILEHGRGVKEIIT